MLSALVSMNIPLSEGQIQDLSQKPANRLMLAILEEALVTFQKGLNSPLPEHRRRFHEVDRWVASGDTEWPFSFENICSSLLISADYVRCGLRKLKRDAFSKQTRCDAPRPRRERIYGRKGWRGQIG